MEVGRDAAGDAVSPQFPSPSWSSFSASPARGRIVQNTAAVRAGTENVPEARSNDAVRTTGSWEFL
jgi:hypothetical protein